MKPRNKAEKAVDLMIPWLLPITEEQLWTLTSKCFDGHYLTYQNKRGKLTCMACGGSYHIPSADGVCPLCGAKTVSSHSEKYTQKTSGVVCLSQMVNEDWQVFRFYEVAISCKRGRKPIITKAVEQWQKWLRSDGEYVIAARPRFMGRFSYGPISIKNKVQKHYSYYADYRGVYLSDTLYDGIMPTLRRNGLSENTTSLDGFMLSIELLSGKYPIIETLLKSGKYELLRYLLYKRRTDAEMAALKVALRHKYEPYDWGIWFDTICNIERCHMDYRNPKYCCPEDLDKTHQFFLDRYENECERIRVAERKKMIAERLAREQKEAKEYVETHKKYFGLDITDGNIHITPLKSVVEFADEGEAMHHCVYVNGYYLNKNSLILSARIDGERVETIEVGLDEMKVLQCYGACNKFTQHHKTILNLMNANMAQISALRQKRA